MTIPIQQESLGINTGTLDYMKRESELSARNSLFQNTTPDSPLEFICQEIELGPSASQLTNLNVSSNITAEDIKLNLLSVLLCLSCPPVGRKYCVFYYGISVLLKLYNQ